MIRSRAWAPAALALAMTAMAACQLVSGIGDLSIVDDAGDAHAGDATMEASGQSDAPGDSTNDSTVEAASDGPADTQVEAANDAPMGTDGGSDGTADAEGGTDATLDASDAADAGDAPDADASDAADAGDGNDGAIEAGPMCQFGWQCPNGYCSLGQCVDPPSCQGATTTCGPSSEDCCRSIVIQVGDAGVTFKRSFDPPNYMDMSNPATLAGNFALDKYEVTVERFEKFLASYQPPVAGVGAYPPVPGTGWVAGWTIPPDKAQLESAVSSCAGAFMPTDGGAAALPSLPMNCVDWYVAFAFCAWDGSRLPTEAEWNFAAAGGAAQRMYPWSVGGGPVIDSTYAWYDCAGPGGTMEMGGGPGPCTQSAMLPVGSETPGTALFGHVDFAGSMVEPTLDYYSSTYLNPCTNCVETNAASGQRVYRGGSFVDPPATLDNGYRQSVGPTFSAGNTGIRCAR